MQLRTSVLFSRPKCQITQITTDSVVSSIRLCL